MSVASAAPFVPQNVAIFGTFMVGGLLFEVREAGPNPIIETARECHVLRRCASSFPVMNGMVGSDDGPVYFQTTNEVR